MSIANSKCCEKEQLFRFKPIVSLDQDMLGLIFCAHCGDFYRPAHKGHIGGGTPENCEVCKRWIETETKYRLELQYREEVLKLNVSAQAQT